MQLIVKSFRKETTYKYICIHIYTCIYAYETHTHRGREKKTNVAKYEQSSGYGSVV